MDKVIVITGAGGVLCSGFAEFLAAKGAKVALLDINEQAASAVAEKSGQTAARHLPINATCLTRLISSRYTAR